MLEENEIIKDIPNSNPNPLKEQKKQKTPPDKPSPPPIEEPEPYKKSPPPAIEEPKTNPNPMIAD